MSGEQLPTLKRRAYKDQVFCWIESGETEKVIKFIEAYEHHAKQFITMNSWSLPMFACRYGNLELLKYLHQKKFTQDGNYQYTLVHAACFGNEIDILKYLIDVLKKDPVPISEQQPPLKICFRAENQSLAELLISRGAYYQYGSFCHNVKLETIQNPQGQPQHKYKTIQRDSKNEIIEVEVPASLVFSHTNITKDSNMLPFLRFCRIRNLIYTKRVSDNQNIPFNDEKKKENFNFLAKIAFEKQENRDRILEYLVGKKEVRENSQSQSGNINQNSQQIPQQHPNQYQTPQDQHSQPQHMLPPYSHQPQQMPGQPHYPQSGHPQQNPIHQQPHPQQQQQQQNPSHQHPQQQQMNQPPQQYNNPQGHPNPNYNSGQR